MSSITGTTTCTFPTLRDLGFSAHAIRFANSDPASPAGQYVATYETAWEEVEKAMPAHREAGARTRGDEDRGTPLIQPVTVGVFKRKGGEFNAAAKPSLGMLLVLSNCKDTHDEKEFNRWYEDVHIPDILDTGAYHTAYRYVSTDPEATKGKYLAIYETDNRDAAAAREKLNAVRADWTARDRLYGRNRRGRFTNREPHLANGLARKKASPLMKRGWLNRRVSNALGDYRARWSA